MSLVRTPILRHGLTLWDKALLPEAEVASRLRRVRAMMASRGLDALVVYSDMARGGDVAFLTNFHSFDARMPGLVLVTPEHLDAIFKVTGRDLTYIAKYVWVTPQSVDFLSGSLADKLADIAAERGLKRAGIRVGFAGGGFAPATLRQGVADLFAEGEVLSIDAMFAHLRRDKSTAERVLLRLAAAKGESVMAELASRLVPGMSEAQLVARVDYLARKAGAQDVDVLLHVASASNGTWPHGHFPFRPAGERALPGTGAVGLYVALQYHGYWIELSQSVFLNAPRSADVETHQLALAAFDELGSRTLRPGAIASASPASEGTAIWVHGIGLDRSEPPLPMDGDPNLLEGDIVAAHVAVRRNGVVAFFGRPVAVSQASAPLVPPGRVMLAVRSNA